MRRVSNAAVFPHRCAVLPYIGQKHSKGFFDPGSEMVASARDQHVYVSVVAVEEMARQLGWVGPVEMRQARVDVARANAHVEQLEAEIADLRREAAAIDLLESKGYTTRKKPGRPRREEV